MINPMKDSSVAWIGEVPSDWEISKIKYTTKLNGRIGWQGLTSSEYKDEGPFLITGTDFKEGGINFDSAVHIEESRWAEAKQIQVKNGDLLITKDGTVGKVAIIDDLDDKASLNSGVLRIQTTDEVNRKFLYYVLLSEEFWIWFNYSNSGASTILHLYQNVFERFTYVIPPLQEQKEIANFLDVETEKLDDAKDLLEKQIERLKEYRKSLIWETVTKGLDKNVPMKDSGVDWIGEIPESWVIKPLKYIADISTGDGDTQDAVFDGDFPFFVRSQTVQTINSFSHDEEAIMTAGDGVGVGRVFHHFKGKFKAHQRVYILSNFKEINTSFLFNYFSSNLFNVVLTGDAKSTVDSVRLPMLKNFPVTIPSSVNEQSRIADFLNSKNKVIDKIISKIQSQIEIIDKQKKTLIYDYVTGKRRVI
ncbi:putative type I restriction endonuclease subunit S, HsdS [Brochothrix thermosphacta]|uniref:restriction endonuclease subunit S n=1 Tax=Brochothrix thermosphacta TaxID=2756 RepID=UPI000D777444|nr:restriction endonuclease subunit S [Brochothrix thermosphacta]SPN73063.1 putative type I restriction endonuclease subunit S, HsdS [Brochothrix thermosphacta]